MKQNLNINKTNLMWFDKGIVINKTQMQVIVKCVFFLEWNCGRIEFTFYIKQGVKVYE